MSKQTVTDIVREFDRQNAQRSNRPAQQRVARARDFAAFLKIAAAAAAASVVASVVIAFW